MYDTCMTSRTPDHAYVNRKIDPTARKMDFLRFLGNIPDEHPSLPTLYAMSFGNVRGRAYDQLDANTKDKLKIGGFVDDNGALTPECATILKNCIVQNGPKYRLHFDTYRPVLELMVAQGIIPKTSCPQP